MVVHTNGCSEATFSLNATSGKEAMGEGHGLPGLLVWLPSWVTVVRIRMLNSAKVLIIHGSFTYRGRQHLFISHSNRYWWGIR